MPDFKGSNLHSALWEATAKKSAALRSSAFETGGGSGLCAGSLCERYILSDVEVTAARGFSRSKLLRFFDRIWEAWWEIPFTPSKAYKRRDNVEKEGEKERSRLQFGINLESCRPREVLIKNSCTSSIDWNPTSRGDRPQTFGFIFVTDIVRENFKGTLTLVDPDSAEASSPPR